MYPSRLMIKTKLRFWETNKKVDKWYRSINTFFVLGIGRSGTKFLSNLLNKRQKVFVAHEPVGSDFRAYREAFYSERRAKKYFNKFRKKEIYLRMKNLDIKIYGEVNSVIRRHVNAIKSTIPSAKLFHLIRDGRDVVRSMISRITN